MDRRIAFAFVLMTAGVASIWHAQDAPGQPTAWTALFDGKNIDNWDKLGDANWHVADGAIVADKSTKGFSYLVSRDDYADLEIRAEFWADADANSGIFVRCTDPKNVSSKTAYEINIYDKRPDQIYGTGSIRKVAKPLVKVTAAEKWNSYDIRIVGSQFFVMLNGIKTIDGASDTKFRSGRVALQYAAGAIKFRKVDIRRL